MIRPLKHVLAAACASAAITAADPQQAATPVPPASQARADSACTYASCALWIAPPTGG
jgi:hypothetical protein